MVYIGRLGAIAVEFLSRNRIFHGSLGNNAFVVLTDDSVSNRVYESVCFDGWEGDVLISGNSMALKEESMSRWRVTKDALVSITNDAKDIQQLGWFSAQRILLRLECRLSRDDSSQVTRLSLRFTLCSFDR